MRSFKIYGIWPQASRHTHNFRKCSHASVGLAQLLHTPSTDLNDKGLMSPQKTPMPKWKKSH